MSEKDIIWRRRFFAFLKENGIYEKWLYNLRKRHQSNEIWWWNSSYQILYKDKCNGAIIRAFCWIDTKEGHDFWNELNDEWCHYTSSLTEKKIFYD